jgi:hypothetical protein
MTPCEIPREMPEKLGTQLPARRCDNLFEPAAHEDTVASKSVTLKTQPARNAHLVKQAIENATEKYGKAWHLLSRDIQDALVRSEAFILVSMPYACVDDASAFARDVIRELNARYEES